MISFAAFVVLVAAAAATGMIFRPDAWYEGLAKPDWTPRPAVFSVVWTILYFMIAVSGWLAWRQGGLSGPIVLWAVQLVLNAAWSYLFFGRHRMDVAFADICLLLAVIGAYVVAVSPVSVAAAVLFLPYGAWVATAAALNRAIWTLNPAANGTWSKSGSD